MKNFINRVSDKITSNDVHTRTVLVVFVIFLKLYEFFGFCLTVVLEFTPLFVPFFFLS